jgi:hypothetical protein
MSVEPEVGALIVAGINSAAVMSVICSGEYAIAQTNASARD